MSMPAASLVDYLESSAREWPDRPAVVDPSGRVVSYRELDEQSSRVAGFLIAAGVRPGDRVGVIVPKGIDAIMAFFGAMKARAAYVPADYTAPIERNRSILSDCQVKVAVLTPRCASVLDEYRGDLPSTVIFVGDDRVDDDHHGVRVTRWTDVLGHAPATARGRSRDDLAYILYTSGSTGVPKGVMLSQENALSFVDWCSDVFRPMPADRFSSHAPFHFDLSILDVYVPLKHGATLYVISEDLGKTPKELSAFIAEHRLTVWYSTPSILSLLTQFGDLRSKDLGALRLVLFAGEVFPVKHLRDLTEILPGPEYYNLYGPTETNVCTFAHIPLPVPPTRDVPYPIGPACAHCDGLVLDEQLQDVPAGEEGLLYIAGPSVFLGYWNRPEQNRTVFLERSGRRWYNTGDVVRDSGGEGYVYVGRRDRMVKRRGYRIELGEIERAMYGHPAVAEAAVIAVSDSAAGVRIVACLSTHPDTRPSVIQMKVFSGGALPSYMNPDVFLFLDALPRTSTDKIDYQRLARMARGEEPIPPAGTPSLPPVTT